jgi:hypothetical protein
MLTAGAAPAQGSELTRLGEELAAVDDELRAWAVAVNRRPSPTPATLRSLLSLARADLAAQLTEDAEPDEQLVRVVHLAQRVVPGTEHAAVSVLLERESLRTPASTSTVPVALDTAQQELREGPAFQVGPAHETVRIDDFRFETRWPKYAAKALELGLRSALICELPATRGAGGILSLYSGRRRAFTAAAELVAPVFASRAAIAVAHADEVLNLRRAIGSRQVIGEAVGILMERHRLSGEQAFERLVTASQRGHVKLRDLAARITETGEEPDAVAP